MHPARMQDPAEAQAATADQVMVRQQAGAGAHSEAKATATVTRPSRPTAQVMVRWGSSSSPPSSMNRAWCVFSWKYRYPTYLRTRPSPSVPIQLPDGRGCSQLACLGRLPAPCKHHSRGARPRSIRYEDTNILIWNYQGSTQQPASSTTLRISWSKLGMKTCAAHGTATEDAVIPTTHASDDMPISLTKTHS